MLANIAANLVADVVWLPLLWFCRREWLSHRDDVARIEARVRSLVDNSEEGPP